MSYLVDSSLEQLEFDRILEHIAGLAASSLGAEHLLQLRPLMVGDACRLSVQCVAEMRLIVELGEEVPLNDVYDVREALSISRIPGAVLQAETLDHVRSTISAVRKVRDFLLRRHEYVPCLCDLVRQTYANRLVEKHIEDAIDPQGTVRDGASRELARIRSGIIDKSTALRSRLQKILRRVSDEELVTDEYVTLREGRLVLPVRAESKRKIPGIIHGESQSGNTVFLEPAEIFDVNNEIAELTFAERREVERILRTLTEEVGADASKFLEGVNVLGELDSILARAKYACRCNCVAPEILDVEEIRLHDARHPLLLMRHDNIVPMSIELDAHNRAVIVSGPNAGGKTVAMKTLGLVTALALSGIHPPAARCVVHPCNVFTDIGDQQSLENDLSTFSSHMSRISAILQGVSAGDIVLLDEVGTGTDPDEGGAIAAAVIDSLLSKGSFILATTHHSFLKVYAYETDGVSNAGMEFNRDTITPTYRFLTGVPGNSYAFELLTRLGFDDAVIDRARARMGDERNRMTEIIEELEQNLVEARRFRDESRVIRNEAEELRRVHHDSQVALQAQKKSLIENARIEAGRVLSGANSLIENALREIREGASANRIRELRKQVDVYKCEVSTHTANEPSGMPAETAFRIGDAVRMIDGTRVGEVVIEPDDKGIVVVLFGDVRMRASVNDLRHTYADDTRRITSGTVSIANAGELETRVDIRGMYPNEAEVRLEQAITAAMNANVTQLDIIHGKGTGALRKCVHEFLRLHPGVDTFRLGALTEGGAGLTIVNLK